MYKKNGRQLYSDVRNDRGYFNPFAQRRRYAYHSSALVATGWFSFVAPQQVR